MMMNAAERKTTYDRTGGRSGSSLFLLELIIAIGFFAVAGMVCIRLFLYAHEVSRQTSMTTAAVHAAQNCAESFLAAEGDRERTKEILAAALPEWAVTDETDSDLTKPETPESMQGEGWCLSLLSPEKELSAEMLVSTESEDEAGFLYVLTVSVRDEKGTALFSLTVKDWQDTLLQVDEMHMEAGAL